MLDPNIKLKGIRIKGEFFKGGEISESEKDGYQFIAVGNIGIGIYAKQIKSESLYCYSTKHGKLSREDVKFVI